MGWGGGGRRTSPKKQQRAHDRNRKICSTLHNHKSRRTVTITNRFIAAIERKLLQTEFAANVAGLTFFTCIRLTFKGEVATSMVLLYTNSTMVLYTQIAKKLTPSILHSHMPFFSFFFSFKDLPQAIERKLLQTEFAANVDEWRFRTSALMARINDLVVRTTH